VIWPFVITGIVTGSIYSLGGVGLLITYKASRIFNFAYGAIAAVGAYAFYFLHIQEHVSWPLAALVSTVGAGIAVGTGLEYIARVLVRRSLVEQIAATVGLLVAVQSVLIILYGLDARVFPAYLPSQSFSLLGTAVSAAQVITVAVVLAATVGLCLFFRMSRLGVAMRGVVDSPDLLDISGTSPRRVRRWAWVIGSVFAALSGVLLAPSLQLDANTLSLLVVDSFGAAALGAFTSLPVTYLGGLLIGIAGSLIEEHLSSTSLVLAGIAPSLPFIILFIVTVAAPRRWFATAALRLVPPRSTWSAPARGQFAGLAALLAGAVALPFLVSGSALTTWTELLAFVILFLSLGLLVRRAGLVSLCQLTFAAVGAAAFGHIAGHADIPWLLALFLAGLAAIPIGAVLAVPAIRLGGLYLALATFGFGILVQDIFYPSNLMFPPGGLYEPAPSLGWLGLPPGSAAGLYYVALAVTVVCTAGIALVEHSRLGRLLDAMSSPLALETSGANLVTLRVLVFCLSAFFAAVAGALMAVNVTLPTGDFFDPQQSLVLVALVLVAPGTTPWYAVIAGIGYIVVPAYVPGGDTPYCLQIAFGLGAVLIVLAGKPSPPRRLTDLLDRLGGRRGAGSPEAPPAAGRPAPARPVLTAVHGQRTPVSGTSAAGLRLDNLRVAFGGLVAVDELSLAVPPGEIRALIGPNGAGKTTTFNACCGLVRTSGGRVLIDGRDVTAAGPDRRARLGLGRTFQHIELCDALSVAENVALGREASLAGGNPLRHVLSRRGESILVNRDVAAALELCGIAEMRDRTVGSLSTGARRLVELARALAGPFRIVLLDEPSSGLDRQESDRFGLTLRRAVAERGLGILLVEHDIPFVMDLSSYIYVLDFGRPLFEGLPDEVARSEVVRGAYLGTAVAGGSDDGTS
jgi:ABC-type branched-subunit amino acid transport system ATPase component/branched-subunit amino acid ABC-type transport system permease component